MARIGTYGSHRGWQYNITVILQAEKRFYMEQTNRINNPKNKISQLFCRHKHTNWYKEQESFPLNIRGETRWLVCEDCGKRINSMFLEYEGMGFK